jgi:6-pyruvoyl-tetrahydropterin synthase
MKHKNKSFLSIVGDALSPDFNHKSTDWSPGLLGFFHGIFIEPFPGPKKILIPAYMALGLAAIPIAGVYFLGKAGYKAINKDYMDLKRVKEIFPMIYDSGDTELLNKLIPNIQYKGNEDIYKYMFSRFDDNPRNVEKTKKFTKYLILNTKVKPKDFNRFFGHTLAALCAKDCLPAMKFMLNDQDIKEHIVNNKLSYSLNKDELEGMVQYYRLGLVKPDPTLDYLKGLPDEALKFNVGSEPKRKPKI